MWDWLLEEENRQVISWFGGGLVVVVGSLWTAYTYFRKSAETSQETPISIRTGNIHSGGDTVVGSGSIDKRHYDHRTYYGITDIELAKQLGVAETSVRNFFNILDQQQIPIEDWDHSLRQMAERYQALKKRAAQLSSEDPEVQSLQNQARQAIDAAEFEQAETWLDKAVALDNTAAERLITHVSEFNKVLNNTTND